MTVSSIYDRSQLLLGIDAMEQLATARVIIFGVGGVGSWCAEALVRTGIVHLTIVDSDTVSVSNINRQLMATTDTVGRIKVDALKEHLLQINPDADITALREVYSRETADRFNLGDYDFIVDAIDSLRDKADLIVHATSLPGMKFYSSMGAALKLDPTRVSVAEFWKVQGCPLAAALRQRFRRSGNMPRRRFKCVYSPELRPNRGEPIAVTESDRTGSTLRARINGSIVHITAIFGLTIAGLIISNLADRS